MFSIYFNLKNMWIVKNDIYIFFNATRTWMPYCPMFKDFCTNNLKEFREIKFDRRFQKKFLNILLVSTKFFFQFFFFSFLALVFIHFLAIFLTSFLSYTCMFCSRSLNTYNVWCGHRALLEEEETSLLSPKKACKE